MKDKHSKSSPLGTLDRRTFLKSSMIGAAAMGAGIYAPSLLAQSTDDALGTYPKSVKGSTVTIGLTLPMTGVYSAEGQDEKMGYELAIEHLNQGASLMREISPLTSKGVLGKQVKTKVRDTEANPNSAVQAATRFIRKDSVALVTGSSSSAVAIALAKVCDRERTLYMPAIAGSNEVSGVGCQRYSFRFWYYVYSVAKAIAPVIAAELGPDRKAAYLVPDYTYGHTTRDSMVEFTEKEGWTTVTEAVHPLGTQDYSTYLLNLANSGADTLINIDYGADATNSLKQAKEFGLLDKMDLVVPVLSPFLAEEVGPEVFQGAYGANAFWWTLQDDYPMVKEFVEAFQSKFNGKKPHDSAYMAYMNIALWADAVERAESFHPVAVVKALEAEEKRKGMLGDVWFRSGDHQGVYDFPIVKGKKPSEMNGPDDLCHVVDIVRGESVLPEVSRFGCKLGPYT